MGKKKKFSVVVSHPIQYHAVLWQNLAKIENIDFEVLFCSDHGQKVSLDKDFGIAFKWDIPLKEGYKSRTHRNYGFGNGFFKYINPSIIISILFNNNEMVYFHGVNHFTAYFSFWIARLKGAKTIIRNIAHKLGEVHQSKTKIRLRDLIYGSVYRKASFCLYIGELNKEFFKSFKVKDEHLLYAPHIVDNDFFQKNRLNKDKSLEFKKGLGIASDRLVLLFCGKLIPIKQPVKLLDAFAKSEFLQKVTLLFVGDGVLKKDLESMAEVIVKQNDQKEIKFLGFKNQSELPAIYSITDVLLLPTIRETWGLVVNEALNYSTAIVVSDQAGCAPELVQNKTGIVFNNTSNEELKKTLEKLVNDKDFLSNCKENSIKVINNWSIKEYIDSIREIINH